jgi:amino acid adenylation domain-containing protein
MPDTGERFALSASQQNIWDLEQRYSGTSINVISATVRISGRLDFSLLSKTLNLILCADASLRTRLVPDGGRVMQEYSPYTEELFPVFDFSLTDPEGFSHWETAMTREPMQLFDAPLCRFFLFRTGEEQGGLLIKTHHIIFDGWSQVLLCNRIAETYLALLSSAEPKLSQSPSYAIHIQKEKDYLASSACRADEAYWRSMMETPAEPISFKEQRGASVSPVGRRRSYQLPEILNHAVVSFCQEHRVSPFAPYYMALAIAAKRMGAGRRMSIGVPIHNRTDLVARETTGMFVSTLPLVTELDEDWTAEEFNDRLSETWLDLLRHQRFPYERIAELPGLDGGRLFKVALSYQDNLSYKNEDTTVHFSGRWNYGGYQAEQLCIHVTNLEDNRRYTVDYDYLAQLFTDEEIDRLHRAVCTILDQILSHPERPIREVCILSAGEREQVLYTFNRTASPVPQQGPWEVLSAAARSNGRRAALIGDGRRVTYEALCRRAQAMAPAILARCQGEGEKLVAVMLPRGNDLACALAGLMAAGCPWVIISPDLPAVRIAAILKSSGALLLISSADILRRFSKETLGIACAAVEELPETSQSPLVQPDEAPNGLAYVVYTSGSTGSPKGVEITRANLMNFAHGMKGIFPDGAMLSISSVSFDAFVLECVVSLLNGLTVVFANEEQQEDPAALSGLVTGYGVDYMCMTPSRLETYLEYPEFRSALRGCRGILCGGEAFSGELLGKLKELTAAHIYNQYGPSETTVGVSLALLDHCTKISVGRPMPNCMLYVLDDRLQPLPFGVFGELYIGGANVGRGYRGAPELTQKAFLPDPFVSGGRMYRSGDMACWTRDGELRLRGRRDRQLKIRGQRAEPDELAFCLQGHPDVRKAAVKAVEAFGQTVLCAYYVSDSQVGEGELMRYLGERLPLYLLPARLIRLGELPMTSSGKVDEKLLPVPELSGGNTAPATAMQEKILKVFRDVLKQPALGADADYFLFGGNSLNAMEAIGLLEGVLGRRLRISDLYACRTAKRLDEWLGGGEDTAAADVDAFIKAPEAELYPVSPIQQSIFAQCSLAPGSMAYHMPGAFRLESPPDRDRLQAAFRALIAQDDIYRTAFEFEKGALVSRILPEVDFDLPLIEGGRLEDVWRDFLRPFDFASPPLMRAELWRDDGGAWALLIDVHHIVGDGVSTPIMLRRLDALYSGAENAAPEYTYKDYCCYLRAKGDGDALSAWAEHLSPTPAPLDLPGDAARPRPFDFRGGALRFTLSDAEAEACRGLCRDKELTPFMLFSAAYALMLSRAAGKDELILGTPVSGRSRSELWGVCGPFISTLPMRVSASPGQTASDYLGGVRRETLWMLDHQELPLDKVLTKLDMPRELGENPLYQVMFTYRPLNVDELSFAGEPLRIIDTPHSTAKMDLCLEGAETGGSFEFVFEYASSVFEEETIELYSRIFRAALKALWSGLDRRLSELDILPPEDRLRLITRPRQMVSPFRSARMDELFYEQALRTPDAPAVVFHGETVTFSALAQRAGRLAGALSAAGVQAGGKVALCCRRGPDIFAGMLAILSTGCAYVPFLPDFPEMRVRYMLETAEVSAVLCSPDCADAVPADCGAAVVPMTEGEPFSPVPTRGGLAYVLFTSGSTGKPKGVMVSNRALANFCAENRRILELDGGNVLCISNMTFDIFMAEGLLPLSMGRTVIMADEEERALPWRMAKLISDGGVTSVQITPSQLGMCLGSEDFRAAIKNVKLIMLAGEASSRSIVDAASAVTAAKLVDVYGPTEATVYVSASVLEPGKTVTIGKPYSNCRMYVLAPDGRDALPTARGDLYLAGECLADGYINRPDLNEKAFVPDPFFPGERMYRTGDIARMRADGSFECLGRADAQIKLNGLRIELDEINGAAVESGLVRQCVTLLCRRSDGGSYLRAFAVPAGSDAPDERALRASMRRLLPEYMLPGEFVFLSALPSNPSGKVDMPRLAAWEVSENTPAAPAAEKSAEAPKPQSAAPSSMLEAWKNALEREDISETESFFRQGGTSLAALGVLTEYYEMGVSMTLADFYAHPTLKEQQELIGSAGGSGLSENIPADTAVFAPRPAPSAPPAAASLPVKCALVTGASGFLGAHLVRELLDTGGADTVLCLMRDGDRARLLSSLVHYFGGDWCAENSWRVSAVKGDVSAPKFGMDEGGYAALLSRACSVFHAAADVRHYSSDGKSLDTNVAGTVNAADFAMAAGIPFNHVSTVSISGEYIVRDPSMTAVFTESDFDIGQNWEDNIYVRGKFLAEREIYDRMEKGLCARVYRLGRLVGRDSDGMFQPNPASNAVYLTLRGIQAVGAVPEAMAAAPIDLTPIDFCAKAIVALSRADMPVCHVADPAPVTMLEAVRAIKPGVEVLPNADFSARLAAAARGEHGADIAPLVEVWNRIQRSGPAMITPSWERTVQKLVSLNVPLPASGPETRLREYAVNYKEGAAK